MTRYLITAEELRYAINSAIIALDIDPNDDNYIIKSTIKVSNLVLDSLDTLKVDESKSTENPIIRLESLKYNELVEMICTAYQRGKDYRKEQS